MPMGSYSRIEKLGGDKSVYELSVTLPTFKPINYFFLIIV